MNGWFNSSCSGYRANIDSTAYLANFLVGDSVIWSAGYKIYPNGNTSTIIMNSTSLTFDFSYTILDTAKALAVTSTTVVALIAYWF